MILSNCNLNIVKNLELTGIKKYCNYTFQVEMELDWSYN